MKGVHALKRAPLILVPGFLLALGLLMWGAAVAAPVHAQGTTTAPQQQELITHTVQPGDTLARLASRYGTTVSRLVELNGIADPNVIRAGQVLTVSTSSVPAMPQPPETPPTVAVRAGDTLTRLANRYGVTVEALAAANRITDPNRIEVGQILTLPPTTTAEPPPAGGLLELTWELVDWQPADPDYTATIDLDASGGQPPYTYYHDGLVQEGETFQMAWRRCRPKPGSVGVKDANQTLVEVAYWLEAPYCPLGIEIVDPVEGAVLTHDPRHFNIRWDDTVDPPPPEYGIEIEVQEDGAWRLWHSYRHVSDGNRLFFVPDPFPGDLPGRVRMWGIYEGLYPGPKTPWRNFTFRTAG